MGSALSCHKIGCLANPELSQSMNLMEWLDRQTGPYDKTMNRLEKSIEKAPNKELAERRRMAFEVLHLRNGSRHD